VWTRWGTTFALLTAGATLATVLIIHSCGLKLAEAESSKQLLELAAARGYSQSIVFGLQRSDRTPEFYAAGRVATTRTVKPPSTKALVRWCGRVGGVGPLCWHLCRLEEVGQFIQLTEVHVEVIGSKREVCAGGCRTVPLTDSQSKSSLSLECGDRSPLWSACDLSRPR